MKKMIVFAFVSVMMDLGCETIPPSNSASGTGSEGWGAGSGVGGGGGTGGQNMPDAGPDAHDCVGCFVDGDPKNCVPGYDLNACGDVGEACVACSFGETCIQGVCKENNSICITRLKEAGTLGADCASDSDCSDISWCQDHCCDPVVATCFVVGKCAPKRETGEHCDHFYGDHECMSGVCDKNGDVCT